MLNLKKGLALVLAAATAFAFAPVANLGNAVQAEAAVTIPSEQQITLPRTVFASNATPVTLQNQSNADVGTAWRGTNGILIEVKVAVNPSRTYKIFSEGENLKVVKDGYVGATNTVVTQSSAQGSQKTLLTDTNGNYINVKTSDIQADINNYSFTTAASETEHTVLLWADKAGITQTVRFDQEGNTRDQNLYTQVTISIPTNNAVVDGLDIVKVEGNSNNINGDGYVSQAALNSAVTTRNNDGEYALTLNSGDKYYIKDLAGASTTITSWTGATLTKDTVDDKNPKIEDPSKNITTNNVYKDTAAGHTYIFGKQDKDKTFTLENTVRELVPTTRTYAKQPLEVTYKTKEGIDVTTELQYTVDPSDNAIDKLFYNGHEVTNASASKDDAYTWGNVYVTRSGAGATASWDVYGLDAQIHNAGTVQVKAESGDVSFKSSDSSQLSVDVDKNNANVANVKALKAGLPTLYVFVGSTQNNKALVTEIHFHIESVATDEIDVPAEINLDVPSQKAAGAQITETLAPVSKGGLKLSMKQTSGEDVISFNPTTGVINSKEITGRYKVATIRVTSESDSSKNIRGTYKDVNVYVWTLPAANFTVDPVVVEVGKDVSLKANVVTPNPYSIVWNTDGTGIYTLSNPESGLLHTNDQTTSRLYGSQVGTAKVTATITGTATTRPTTKSVDVTVTDSAHQNIITPDDNSKALVLKTGDTVNISAKTSIAGTEAKFSTTSDVVTVTAGATSGSAIVTAVKAGTGIIVAKADGASDYEIPVIVSDDNTVTVAPAKVTSVKVSNKKGAYVSVKWASQGKNINYRVWKKVGNGKWIAKNVAGSKTTLKVKKGAKVQVKVKAYVKDSAGKTTWGPKATKAKTFKTDKK